MDEIQIYDDEVNYQYKPFTERIGNVSEYECSKQSPRFLT